MDLSGATSGELNFWTSYDTEADWDFLFVEAHEVGSDEWTTLPEANGHTTQGTGESCLAGWVDDLHPFLAHYMDASCAPIGSTGEWNAATGASNGWTEWSIDLSGFAGSQVEVSISYATDWAFQNTGVFLDDVSVLVDGAPVSETGFEDDLGVWTVSGSPDGSVDNSNDWIRTQLGFEEGAVTTTEDTVYVGFGLEGLAPAERNGFLERAMGYLLD